MTLQLPDLADFEVSPTLGFLPNEAPSTSFSEPQFAEWDQLIEQLPALISTRTLRSKVASLPYLDPGNLASPASYRRAYVVLAFLIHAYVWTGADETGPVEAIPPQLAEPFLSVCDKLGMQPVLSYAGLCLWNWAPTTHSANPQDSFPDLDVLRSLSSFTGSRGEEAFYLVPVLVEAEGGPLVPLLLGAVEALQRNDVEQVKDALTRSAEIIVRMKQHLPKLYSTLDAGMFYHELRPFLSGGKGMEDKGLHRGFVFQKRDGSEQEVMCIGGSAAQSSLFQFLDIVLGVVHESRNDKAETVYQTMKAYMPAKHRRFLETVSQLPSIRPFVEQNGSDDALREAYDDCMKQLRQWRSSHIAVVSKYIVRPARLEQKNTQDPGPDMGSTTGSEDDRLQGTGGSALIPFLKQSRDETKGFDVAESSMARGT